MRAATLQKLMRHRDIKTTMDYYVAQDADEIAAELWATQNGNTSGNTNPIEAVF